MCQHQRTEEALGGRCIALFGLDCAFGCESSLPACLPSWAGLC